MKTAFQTEKIMLYC